MVICTIISYYPNYGKLWVNQLDALTSEEVDGNEQGSTPGLTISSGILSNILGITIHGNSVLKQSA
jgi:hypothetical protein